MSDINQIADSLRLFVAPSDIGEIRVIGTDGGAPFGFYFTHEQIERASSQAAAYSVTAKGVYLVMNRISDDLKSRPKLIDTNTLTKDADIVRRTNLLIDFDPSSPERGADDSATEAEKEAARLCMERCVEWLRDQYWPEPVFADSGNGWHLLYRIDLPNDEETQRLIRSVLQGLSKRFSDDHVAVDISVHNASRITKCYGTLARKGADRPERPHRLSKLLFVPAGGAAIVARELLEAVVADGSLFTQPANSTEHSGGNLDGCTLDKPKLILPETFPVGGRHETLLKVAGAVRSFGANETEIAEILRVFNRTRCSNGKPDDELQKIARDYSHRDCNLSMKALIECATEDQAETAERQQKLRHALQHGIKKLNEGGNLDDIAGAISMVLGTITATAKPQTFKAMTSAELDAADLRVEFLVDDVLVRRQPFIIAAAKKMLKTNGSIDLTLSLASRCPFLGTFYVPKPVRVALMSGESGDAVIQETARRIARSKEWVNLSDYTNAIWSFDLPRLGQPQTKRDLTKFIGDHALEVLIVDPAYLALDLSDDAANLFSVGKKLMEITEIMRDTDCTIGIVHHNKRSTGDPFAVPELESIAWAGFQEWARQWLLLGRREAYNPEQAGSHRLWLSVGGSAGHSGLFALDIEEGSHKDPGGRRWDVEVQNASEAIAANIEQREEAKASRADQKAAAKIEADAMKLFAIYTQTPEGTTEKAAREEAGMSGTRSRPATAKLLASGKIEACQVTRNNRPFDGFRGVTTAIGTSGTDRDSTGTDFGVPMNRHGSGLLPLRGSPGPDHQTHEENIEAGKTKSVPMAEGAA